MSSLRVVDDFKKAENAINENKINDKIKQFVKSSKGKNSLGVSLRVWAMYQGIYEWIDLITTEEAPLALLYAIKGGEEAIARKIIENKTFRNINLYDAVDNIDFTALHYAIAQGFNDISKDIIKKYPESLKKVSQNHKITPLHIAVKYGNYVMMKVLLEHKVEPKEFDCKQQVPYEYIFECNKKLPKDEYKKYLCEANKIAVPTHSKIEDLSKIKKEVRNEEGILSSIVNDKNLTLYRDIHCQTILHYAVLAGNLKVVKQIIAELPYVDVSDKWGVTPLMIAMAYPDIAEILIKNGADIRKISLNGICFSFPIISDILIDSSPTNFRGNVNSVSPILRETTRICGNAFPFKHSSNGVKHKTIPSSTMQSRIITSSFSANLNEKYFKLIDPYFADPKDNHNLVVHKVVGSVLIQPFRALLDRMNEIDPVNDLNETPLMIAAQNGSIDIVDELIKRGANLEPRGPNAQIFHRIALCPDDTLAEGIFEKIYKKIGEAKFGEFVKSITPQQNNPLHIALKLNNPIAEQFLEKFRSLILSKNAIGETPLMVALDAGVSPNLVKRMIELEPKSVTLKGNDYTTVLHKAAGFNSAEVLCIVIEILEKNNQFFPMQRNSSNQAAIDVAIEKRVNKNVQILMKYYRPAADGAKRPNMNPLMYAVDVGDLKIFRMALNESDLFEEYDFRKGRMTALEYAGLKFGMDKNSEIRKKIYLEMMDYSRKLRTGNPRINSMRKNAEAWFNAMNRK